jgi:hypothetical protein
VHRYTLFVPNRDERAFVEMHNQIVIATTDVHRIPPFKIDFGGTLLAYSTLNRFEHFNSTGIYA